MIFIVMMDCILNTIKHHKMTYGLVSVQGWPLNTGKNNKERQTWDCHRVDVAACRGGRLIQVTNTAFV